MKLVLCNLICAFLFDVFEGDGFKVYFDLTDSWIGGYTALQIYL